LVNLNKNEKYRRVRDDVSHWQAGVDEDGTPVNAAQSQCSPEVADLKQIGIKIKILSRMRNTVTEE
jgi:hypothetical protein